jgi:hypothetical protein
MYACVEEGDFEKAYQIRKVMGEIKKHEYVLELLQKSRSDRLREEGVYAEGLEYGEAKLLQVEETINSVLKQAKKWSLEVEN